MEDEGFYKLFPHFAPQAQTLQTKKPQQKGNFLTHLLPTIGGTGGGVAGGALGGAAAGTAVLPGIGTAAGALIGALAGGAAGGAAGKVGENVIEGNNLGSGVAGQGLEQGVLSAGPIRLLKGAKAGVGAIRGGEDLASAISSAGDASAAPGLLTKTRQYVANKGAQTEARAGGFGIGEKVSGSDPLGFYDSAAITKNLKAEGIKPGSPENRLKQVEDALNTRGKQIDIHLTDNNAALGDNEKQAITQKFLDTVNQQPGVDDLTRKKAGELADNFQNQTSDLKSLVKFRRGLDSQAINFNQNPSAALVAKQLAARTLRDTLSDTTNKLAPGIKGLNKSYSNLINAKEYLIGGAKAISDQSQGQGGGGLFSRALTNDTAQMVKSKGGALAQKALPGELPNPVGVKAIASRTVPVGLADAVLNAQPTNNSNTNMPTSPNIGSSTLAANSNDSNTNMGSLSQNVNDMSSTLGDQQGSASPYTKENLMADIQRDPKNASKYIDNYTSLDAIFNPKQTDNKLNSTQQQQAFNAQSGLTSLQKIADTLSSNPNAAKLAAIPGGSIAANLTGTGEYKAAINNATDVIGRLRSGGAIGQEEEKNFLRLLPQAGDSSDTINYKLQQLSGVFQSFANPTPAAADLNSSSGNSDLTSALMSAGYSQ